MARGTTPGPGRDGAPRLDISAMPSLHIGVSDSRTPVRGLVTLCLPISEQQAQRGKMAASNGGVFADGFRCQSLQSGTKRLLRSAKDNKVCLGCFGDRRHRLP